MNYKEVFTGKPVELNEVLDNREARVYRRNSILKSQSQESSGLASSSLSPNAPDFCIISFTLNIAGPIKQFPLASFCFDKAYESLIAALHPFNPQTIYKEDLITGCEALIHVKTEALNAKKITVQLENTHPIGRLFDLDVYDFSGQSIARSLLNESPRTCLICGKEAKICGRSRAHSLKLIQQKTCDLMMDFYRDEMADAISYLASRSLLYEVSISPKPGLVDRYNNGSHKDMDFFTFIDSTLSLYPYFGKFFLIGFNEKEIMESYNNKNADYLSSFFDDKRNTTQSQLKAAHDNYRAANTNDIAPGNEFRQLFYNLRTKGLEAQDSMNSVTKGVNTHQGAIFSMAVLCGALGYCHPLPDAPVKINELRGIISQLGKYALEDYNLSLSSDPEFGTGARGEAASGFATVFEISLPEFYKWRKQGLSLNDAGALTLISIIANTEDTNIYRRGGTDGAVEIKKRVGEALESLPEGQMDNFTSLLTDLDLEFINKNISPGGSADILSLTLFIHFLIEEGICTL